MSPPLSWSFPFTFSNRKRVYGWNQLDENRISLWNLCPSPYPNQAELITLPCFHCVKNQITSVVQSCLTLCDPMNCSTPGLPVPHQLPEFTQTHIHRVGEYAYFILNSCDILFFEIPSHLPTMFIHPSALSHPHFSCHNLCSSWFSY